MTIPELIFQHAANYPDHLAVEDYTYRTLNNAVTSFARFLSDLDFKPGDRVAIFSENRPEWVIADLATQLVGGVTVPIHSSFTQKYVTHILNDAPVKALAASDSHLFAKLNLAPAILNIPHLIYFSANRILGLANQRYTYFNDILSQYQGQRLPVNQMAGESDTATIVYTSGTTGLPKGVVLTHANIISNIEAIKRALPVGPDDRLLSVLPLSHIFERTAGYYTPLVAGAGISYARDFRKLAADLIRVRPTILIGVPRVFEKAYEKVQSKKLFQVARKFPGHHWLLRRLIRQRFGGKIKFCISGGAALPVEIARFFADYGLLILEGFGLTETSPVVACNRLTHYRFGSCGLALDNLEVKLAVDSELLVKGPSVFSQYLNLPDKTAVAFTPDNFFKTGDLARVDADGFIQIIGRKKNIIVLSTGKNVQPEEIEAKLCAGRLIEQAMIVGEGRKMITALIVPDWELLGQQESWDKLNSPAQEELAYRLIAAEIDQLLEDFPEHEQVKKFALVTRPWSAETDELSPTLKIKRANIAEHFQTEINRLYQ